MHKTSELRRIARAQTTCSASVKHPRNKRLDDITGTDARTGDVAVPSSEVQPGTFEQDKSAQELMQSPKLATERRY